ncbi:nSTAND1 domain-containing NTPase [Aquamicrobium soli]|uniref:AAA family ATPase n=1 Tax=Aquamicrobium soli TaxID=1811518 RepID=A0ABV7KAD9_9HYPH
MATDDKFSTLLFQIGNVFTPGSPVNEKDLFAGRIEQIRKVLATSSQRGYHAVLYGERGVGKTSLANIIKSLMPAGTGGWLVPRINCDGTDTFTSLWRKALSDIRYTHEQRGAGFTGEVTKVDTALIDQLPQELTPNDIRRVLSNLSQQVNLIVAFDEFDRLSNPAVSVLMADTIKTLSDYAVSATVLLIGVADSVDGLVEGHQSVERALVQIPMPRMSAEEVRQILDNGFHRLGMTIDKGAADELVGLSQGLPYITHLLALESGKAALRHGRLGVSSSDVDEGIREALSSWQQTTTKAYYDAVQSSQPGNIYREVLLACALAETDDLGFFSAGSIRLPLRVITGREYDIPNFAQHLKNFSDESRGSILQRTGETRRIRYRFSSPLLRPFIIMRGFSDGLLTRQQMKKMAV